MTIWNPRSSSPNRRTGGDWRQTCARTKRITFRGGTWLTINRTPERVRQRTEPASEEQRPHPPGEQSEALVDEVAGEQGLWQVAVVSSPTSLEEKMTTISVGYTGNNTHCYFVTQIVQPN